MFFVVNFNIRSLYLDNNCDTETTYSSSESQQNSIVCASFKVSSLRLLAKFVVSGSLLSSPWQFSTSWSSSGSTGLPGNGKFWKVTAGQRPQRRPLALSMPPNPLNQTPPPWQCPPWLKVISVKTHYRSGLEKRPFGAKMILRYRRIKVFYQKKAPR